MLRTKAVYLQIKGTTSANLERAVISVGSTVLFGSMPVLLSILVLASARSLGVPQLKTLVLGGELLMVSNAIVSAATMLIGKERSAKEKFPGGELFILLAALLLVLTGCLFVAIKMFDLLNYKNTNEPLLMGLISFLFVFGILYAFLVILIDGTTSAPPVNPEDDFEKDQDQMLKELQSMEPDADDAANGGAA